MYNLLCASSESSEAERRGPRSRTCKNASALHGARRVFASVGLMGV